MALSDDAFSDLQAAAVLARETADSEGWVVITDRIKAEVAKRQEKMIAGRCESWEQYRKYADWLECALWVLALPAVIDVEVETHRDLRREEGM